MSDQKFPGDDPLVRDYDSRLQSLILWGSPAPPLLREYLKDAGLELSSDDPRLMELMRVDIRRRATVVQKDQTTVLESLVAEYPEIKENQFLELAILEWQVRAQCVPHPDLMAFAERLRPLNRVSHEKLVAVLQSHDETQLGRTEDRQPDAGTALDGLTPGDQIGSFEVGEPIGGGGMGIVFKARQSGPIPRDVALKIIRTHRPTSDILARFNVERQSLAVMQHPNIAKVFDAGVTPDGRPFFVMELVTGLPLTEFCEKNGLGLHERLLLFEQVCRAIQHAHQKGVIHRDIKPGNILVAMSEEGPFAKVIDFGLARVVSETSEIADNSAPTIDGQVVGTLRYMSPEQAAGLVTAVDVRTDVYQLGVLLYELLTGVTPVEALSLPDDSLESVLSAIRTIDPARPSARVSSNQRLGQAALSFHGKSGAKLIDILEGDLDWIVMKAISKEPERRYQSVAHLSDDVDHFLAGRPIVARPPSLIYRLSKTLRRHKPAVAIVGVSAIAFFGIMLQSYRAEIANRQKEILERNQILGNLLVEEDGTELGEDRLVALEQALGMSQLPEEDRVNLEIARIETLHRMERGAEARKFLPLIKPATQKQEGQVELWQLLTSTDFEKQKAIAVSLLARAQEVSLKEDDRRFLTSLTASTRAEAIHQLESMLDDYPRHEHGRKLLLALFLFQGDTVEFDKHYETASLLFPRDNTIEYAAAVSYACRAERQRAERQLERWEGLPGVSGETGKFGKKLVAIILDLAEAMNRTGLWVEDSKPIDPTGFLKSVIELMGSYPDSQAAFAELFGTSLSVGRGHPVTSVASQSYLAQLSSSIAVASMAQMLGRQEPMLNLFSELEEKTPFRGDALFSRTRAWAVFAGDTNDYAGAVRELEDAVAAPCIFSQLRQQVVFECMLCHMMLFRNLKVESHRDRGVALAREWVRIANTRPLAHVVQVINALQFCGFPEEALQLLRDFRTLSPENVNLLIENELQLLKAMKRYPELFALINKRLEETHLGEEQRVSIRKLKQEAMMELSDVLNQQQEADH